MKIVTQYVDSVAFNTETLFLKKWLIENSSKGKQCDGTYLWSCVDVQEKKTCVCGKRSMIEMLLMF